MKASKVEMMEKEIIAMLDSMSDEEIQETFSRYGFSIVPEKDVRKKEAKDYLDKVSNQKECIRYIIDALNNPYGNGDLPRVLRVMTMKNDTAQSTKDIKTAYKEFVDKIGTSLAENSGDSKMNTNSKSKKIVRSSNRFVDKRIAKQGT